MTVTLTMSGCSQLYTWHDVAIVATFISTLLITYLSLTGLFGETNSEVCVLNLRSDAESAASCACANGLVALSERVLPLQSSSCLLFMRQHASVRVSSLYRGRIVHDRRLDRLRAVLAATSCDSQCELCRAVAAATPTYHTKKKHPHALTPRVCLFVTSRQW